MVESRRTRRNQVPQVRKGDIREAAILRSLTELLQKRSLAGISVDTIAKEAGISRSAYYFYFSSQMDAFGVLLERAFAGIKDVLPDVGATPPRDVAYQLAEGTSAVWREHSAVLCNGVESLSHPIIDAIWQEVMATAVSRIGDWIVDQRRRGAAIDTAVPAHDIASSLTWMIERGNYQLFRKGHSRDEEERLVETFVAIFIRSAGFDIED